MLKRLARTLLPEPPSLFYMGRQNRLVREFVPPWGTVLNIGSGRKRYGANMLNLDIRAAKDVDVIADAHMLPFRTESLGFVLCESALEHLREPQRAVAEMERVLKPQGRFLAIVSFMTPFHAEAGTREDFQRYAVEGLRELFSKFESLEAGPAVGPASAFCLHAQFFLASLAGLGCEKLFWSWMRVFAWLLWPLKYLDRFLLRDNNADTASADLYCTGCKGDKGSVPQSPGS